MHRFFAFVRLSRPSFLAGGFLLYAIGVLLALRHGAEVDWAAYAAGQVAVTAAQLMTHYLNELADVETDVLNRHRTSFSGGSAVLADGVLPPRTAVLAAGVACAVSVVAAALGVWWTGAWAAAAVYALMWAGAWSYSARPLSMAGSGFGELTAALVVALAVPSLGYALQTGGWSTDVLLVAAPLVALCWAMIVAFEFPDFEADRATGKRTLLVRMGHRRTAALYMAVVLASFVWMATLAILLPLFTFPLAAAMVWGVWRVARGGAVSYRLLTLGAIALFGVTAFLSAIEVWPHG